MAKFFIKNDTGNVVKINIPGIREFIFPSGEEIEVPTRVIGDAIVKDYHTSLGVSLNPDAKAFQLVVK